MILQAQTYTLSEQLDILAGSLPDFVPELLLAGILLIGTVIELIWGKKHRLILPVFLLAGLAATVTAVWLNKDVERSLFLDMIRADGFAVYFKLLFSAGAVLVIGVSLKAKELKDRARGLGEYFLVLIGMMLGLFLMSMATNLLMMYLALELVSISSYILTAYTRSEAKAAEASIKYFIYGAFSSGIMVYGISWLYGLTGTLDMGDPAFMEGLVQAGTAPVTLILVLVMAGFAFKIAAAPFHFWAPDIYEGAPYPIAAFFAVGPKAAGFAMLIRFVSYFKVGPEEAAAFEIEQNLQLILALIALVSMTLGNISALTTATLRRLIAYSGIAHAGYLLLGVLSMTTLGMAAVVFYLTLYFLMTFGVFLVAGWVQEQTGSDKIEDYRGMAATLPGLAVLMTLFLAGLTGLPPTGGFIGKLYVFVSLWEFLPDPLFVILLVASILNTVISLYYYLRVPALMVFQKPVTKISVRLHNWQWVTLVILALPVLLLGIFGFDQLINFVQELTGNFYG